MMLRHVRSRLGSTLSADPITDVDRLAIADVRAALGIEPTGDPETDREAVDAVLADPDLALSLLEQLPVVCSVVLEGLIEMRGHAGPREVRKLIAERTMLEDDLLEDIAAVLALHGLATVSSDCHAEWEPTWLFLTTAARECCPALLRGLTLPRPPSLPPAPEPWQAPDEDTLRFVELLDRRALRLTRATTFHRGDVRTFCRTLDCAESELIERLAHAVDLGLIGEEETGRLWPLREGITAALSGELVQPPSGVLERLVWEILPEEGWVPEEAVARAVVRIAGLRDLTTVAHGVRQLLRATVWVERGWDVCGVWLRRRDQAPIAEAFADTEAWRALARNPRRPARLAPFSPSQDLEAELRPFTTMRIGDHAFEKMFLPDLPPDEQGLWVPLMCGAAESLRVRYEQAMSHRFAGDRYILPGYAPLLFSDPGWRPRLYSQAQLHAAIESAAAAKTPIEIHVERDSQYSVHWVRPIRVHTEGEERSVLAVDLDTEVGLVFPLSEVVEVDTVRRFTG